MRERVREGVSGDLLFNPGPEDIFKCPLQGLFADILNCPLQGLFADILKCPLQGLFADI